MQTYNNIYYKIYSLENLKLAYKKARKGKKSEKEEGKSKDTEIKNQEKKTEVKLPGQIKIIYDNN